MFNLTGLLSFILVFFIIVFFHELGHYSMARFFDVKINEFFLGFGPILFKKQMGETLYSIRLFPLGGAVAMEGEDDDSEDERAFSRKKAWQKFLIVFAGPLMNFVVAIVIFFGIFATTGFVSNKISKVVDDSAAFKAGVQVGDVVVRIDDVKVSGWDEIIDTVSASNGKSIEVEIIRDSKPMVLTLNPDYKEIGNEKRYVIGVSAIDYNPIGALSRAVDSTKSITIETFRLLSRIFYDKEVQKGISGPVGIYTAVDHFSKRGMSSLMFLTAIISINLGIMNFLPFPALDGGRMFLLLIEMITRRKVNPKLEDNIHKVGFIFLLILMILVVIKDIVAPIQIPV